MISLHPSFLRHHRAKLPLHHEIEDIAVDHQIAPAVDALVNGVFHDVDAAGCTDSASVAIGDLEPHGHTLPRPLRPVPNNSSLPERS